MELMAAGGLFGAMLAVTGPARVRLWGFAAAAALAGVSIGRGMLWDWSTVHLMPLAAGALAGVFAWAKSRLGLALLAAVYLAWIAHRGW